MLSSSLVSSEELCIVHNVFPRIRRTAREREREKGNEKQVKRMQKTPKGRETPPQRASNVVHLSSDSELCPLTSGLKPQEMKTDDDQHIHPLLSSLLKLHLYMQEVNPSFEIHGYSTH